MAIELTILIYLNSFIRFVIVVGSTKRNRIMIIIIFHRILDR